MTSVSTLKQNLVAALAVSRVTRNLDLSIGRGGLHGSTAASRLWPAISGTHVGCVISSARCCVWDRGGMSRDGALRNLFKVWFLRGTGFTPCSCGIRATGKKLGNRYEPCPLREKESALGSTMLLSCVAHTPATS